MIRNWKFHAVAVSVLCAVVTVIYVLFAPAPPAPPVDTNLLGDRAVEIYSATWGMECNAYIKDILERPKKLTSIAQTSAEGNAAQPVPAQPDAPKLEYATKDNALIKVSELCNGKNTCELTPTNETLGLNILDTCGKKLDVSYRCYSYDRLWNLTIQQGDTKKIDCNAAKPTPAK